MKNSNGQGILLSMLMFLLLVKENRGLYIAGEFSFHLGTDIVQGICLWDGLLWKDLPESSPVQPKSIGYVNALVSNGTRVFIGGQFRQFETNLDVNNIMMYDVVSGVVDSLKSGVSGKVNAIKVWQDSVFVAGNFDTLFTSDTPLYNFGQYNFTTQSWSAFSPLKFSEVLSFDVHEYQGILYLFAVGTYVPANQSPSPFVKLYNSTTGVWIDLTGGMTSLTGDTYNVIAVDPISHWVYMGGSFDGVAGEKNLNSLALWTFDNQTWTNVGGGVNYPPTIIYAIEFLPQNNSFSSVIVGGEFPIAGSQLTLANNIAIWDGNDWSALDNGVTAFQRSCSKIKSAFVSQIRLFKDYIYASGRFTAVGSNNLAVNNIARFHIPTQQWQMLGNDSIFVQATDLNVLALTDNGNVYTVAGEYVIFKNSEFRVDSINFYEWIRDSNAWANIPARGDQIFLDAANVRSVANNETNIYVGGKFVFWQNGQKVCNVAKYTYGSGWFPIGNFSICNGAVDAVAVDNNLLYVAGSFNGTNGNMPFGSIAVYNDMTKTWSSLDGGVFAECNYNNSIYAMVVTEDFVVVAGSFSSVGGFGNTKKVYSPNIALWSKKTKEWMSAAGGIPQVHVTMNSQYFVKSLLIVPGTTSIYVGGRFQMKNPDNSTCNNLAVLDFQDVTWVSYPGVQFPPGSPLGNQISCMTWFNSTLVIGGNFNGIIAGGKTQYTANVASYDLDGDNTWEPLGEGITFSDAEKLAFVYALYYDPFTNLLYAGGIFDRAGQTPTLNVATWDGLFWNTLSSATPPTAWSGAVLSLGVTNYDIPVLPVDDNTSWVIFGAVIGGGLLISLALIVTFIVYKVRNKRKHYVPLPDAPVLSSVVIKDIASDVNLKQIQMSDVDIGEKVAVASKLFRGKWKGNDVALKGLLLEKELKTGKFVTEILSELKLLSGITHQNVLGCYGACISDTGEIIAVVQYMEQGSLRDVMTKYGGKLDYKLKLRLLLDSARGLEYLSSLSPIMLHRDLRPSQFLIDKKWRCYVSLLSASRFKIDSTPKLSSTSVKSYQSFNDLTFDDENAAYRAPEVILSRNFTQKSDVYSFGIIMIELFRGSPPYADQSLLPQQIIYQVAYEKLQPSIPDDCPIAFASLITECIDQNPGKRPTFKEVEQRLERLLL